MLECSRGEDKTFDSNDTGVGTVSVDENNLSEDGTITRLGEGEEDYQRGRLINA